MAVLDFTSSLYAKEIRANVWEQAAGFNFQTAAEFDVVWQWLEDTSYQYQSSQIVPEIPNTINADLQSNLSDIVQLLSDPELYISLDYVGDHPSKFIKIEDMNTDSATTNSAADIEAREVKITALCDKLKDATDQEVENAHRALVLQEFLKLAEHLKGLNVDLRNERIESRIERIKRTQENKAVMAHAVPPAPGSAASTYTGELARLCGGNGLYEAVIEALSSASCISNCSDVCNEIDGTYTDQQNIKWSFNFRHRAGTANDLILLINNEQAFSPIPEEPHRLIEAGKAQYAFTVPRFTYGLGSYAIKTDSIAQLLLQLIQSRTEICYALGYSIAYRKEGSFELLVSEFLQNNPSRHVMIEQIKTHQPRSQLSIEEHILRAIIGLRGAPAPLHPQSDLAEEESSSDVENDALTFNVMPIVYSFTIRDFIAHSSDSEDDVQAQEQHRDSDNDQGYGDSEDEPSDEPTLARDDNQAHDIEEELPEAQEQDNGASEPIGQRLRNWCNIM